MLERTQKIKAATIAANILTGLDLFII